MDTYTASTRAAHFVEDACRTRRLTLLEAYGRFVQAIECLEHTGIKGAEMVRVKGAIHDALDGVRGQIEDDMADKAGKYADVLGPIDLSGLEG